MLFNTWYLSTSLLKKNTQRQHLFLTSFVQIKICSDEIAHNTLRRKKWTFFLCLPTSFYHNIIHTGSCFNKKQAQKMWHQFLLRPTFLQSLSRPANVSLKHLSNAPRKDVLSNYAIQLYYLLLEVVCWVWWTKLCVSIGKNGKFQHSEINSLQKKVYISNFLYQIYCIAVYKDT